jgi:N-acetyl-anhydromuramyl-L-alanine amidase AmpD
MPNRIATKLPFTELPVALGNFDTSRELIDRIVIHTMVGTWQAAAQVFNNPANGVSAHYGVKYDGALIHWLEEYYTAYHAGDYGMNQRSIGIEHEDLGKPNDPRPDTLYTESAKLVHDICLFYNIPIDRQHILKHSEVSATQCPDALDIDRIVREASGPLPDPCATQNQQIKDLQGQLTTASQAIQQLQDKIVRVKQVLA